jgi:hypothetical protein
VRFSVVEVVSCWARFAHNSQLSQAPAHPFLMVIISKVLSIFTLGFVERANHILIRGLPFTKFTQTARSDHFTSGWDNELNTVCLLHAHYFKERNGYLHVHTDSQSPSVSLLSAPSEMAIISKV